MAICVVCLKPVQFHDPASLKMRCGHKVHGSCFAEVLMATGKCAVCQAVIVEDDVVFHWRECQRCSNKIMHVSDEEKYQTTLSLYLYLSSYKHPGSSGSQSRR